MLFLKNKNKFGNFHSRWRKIWIEEPASSWTMDPPKSHWSFSRGSLRNFSVRSSSVLFRNSSEDSPGHFFWNVSRWREFSRISSDNHKLLLGFIKTFLQRFFQRSCRDPPGISSETRSGKPLEITSGFTSWPRENLKMFFLELLQSFL